jgi:hypothetical protein
VSQQPRHWSERGPDDDSPRRVSRAPRKRSPRRGARRWVITAIILVLCLGVAGALAWYFTSGRSGPSLTPGSVGSTTTSGMETTTATETASDGEQGTSSSLPVGSDTTSETAPSSSVQAGDSETTVFADEGLSFSFRYPTSWTEFPYERVVDLVGPPDVGIALSYPSGAVVETFPVDYLMFGSYDNLGEPAPPAREAMEEWAAMAEPESPEPLTTVEPLSDFEVNGVTGASKTYSLDYHGHLLNKRICFLSAGTYIYIFTFSGEQADWDVLQPVFDSVLSSFTVSGLN